jgi:hypothetical protein
LNSPTEPARLDQGSSTSRSTRRLFRFTIPTWHCSRRLRPSVCSIGDRDDIQLLDHRGHPAPHARTLSEQISRSLRAPEQSGESARGLLADGDISVGHVRLGRSGLLGLRDRDSTMRESSTQRSAGARSRLSGGPHVSYLAPARRLLPARRRRWEGTEGGLEPRLAPAQANGPGVGNADGRCRAAHRCRGSHRQR